MLYRIQDTSLANWSAPWSIQPTTLISTLITFSKLFLLAAVAEAVSQLKWVYFEKRARTLNDIEKFDSASRGAFGAIAFLFSVRWRALLACGGALIVILAIAMEPFTQQTLFFYNKEVVAGEGAAAVPSIPHANNYDYDTAVEESPYAGQMNTMSMSTELNFSFSNFCIGNAMLTGNRSKDLCPHAGFHAARAVRSGQYGELPLRFFQLQLARIPDPWDMHFLQRCLDITEDRLSIPR